MRTTSLLGLIIGVLFLCGVKAAKDDYNVIDKLYNTLLKNYNKHARPVIDHTQSVNVIVGITAVHLNLNEANHQFDMNTFFYQSWKDERLSWNEADYQGLKVIHIPADQVWRPDMSLYNFENGIDFDAFATVNVLIYSDGTVLYVPPAKFKVPCHPNLRSWPFDQQQCKLVIGSWSQDGFKVDFSIKDNATEIDVDYLDPTDDSHWSMVKSVITVERKYYKCCKEPYPSVNVSVTLQRSSSFYKLTVLVPLFVIALLTLATFFLPPKSSGKIVVGLINLLILCIYLIYFNRALPAPGNVVPLVVIFISTSVVLAGFSVLVAIAATNWLTAPKTSPPAWFLKSLNALHEFPCSICPLLPTAATSRPVTETEKLTEVDGTERQWTRVVLAVDRLTLLVYGVVFAILGIQLSLA